MCKLDPTDIPRVTLQEMWLPMRIAVEAGHGLVLLDGASSPAVAEIEREFWLAYRGGADRGAAILTRFRHLVGAFGHRRLGEWLMRTGYGAIAPSLAAAASLRLNAQWGFPPQRLLWAIRAHREAQQSRGRLAHGYVALSPGVLAA